MLDGIVELVTEATECHACFVYLRDGERLRIRAASRIYAHVVGKVEFALDEGLTGWVARTGEPAFIREDALSDPRMKYVPELEEEHFQSMVAVPVPARSGEVLGVVVLHTVAPREFDEGVLNFLVHTASLVAGAIENARALRGDPPARRRADEPRRAQRAHRRGRAGARSSTRWSPRASAGCSATTRASCGCATARTAGSSSSPSTRPASCPSRTSSRAPRCATTARSSGRWWRMRCGVRTFPAQHEELLQAVANQAALALRNIEHIERLTAENLVRALFEALDDGALDIAEARARAAGCDLDRPHVFIHARPLATGEDAPPWPDVAERVETRLRTLEAGALVDAGPRRAARAAPAAGRAPSAATSMRCASSAPARASPSA